MTTTTLSAHIANLNASLHNATIARRLLIQHAYGRVWLYTTPDGVDGATVLAVGQAAKVAQAATDWARKQRRSEL